MTPTDFFAGLADIITFVCGRPYREEPLTEDEIDRITDRILQFAEKEKANGKN